MMLVSGAPVPRAVVQRLAGLVMRGTDPKKTHGEVQAVHRQLVAECVKVEDQRVLSQVVRVVRKQLKPLNKHRLSPHDRHFTRINALGLIDLLMLEGHVDMHIAFANQKFLAQLVKLIKKSNKAKAKRSRPAEDKLLCQEESDRSLALIACWGKRFQNDIAVGRLFVETYDSLQRKGYSFPDIGQFRQPLTGRQNLGCIESIEQQETLILNTTLMLEDMIYACASSGEPLQGNEVAQQLLEQCQGYQREIASILSSGSVSISSSSEKDGQVGNMLALNERIIEVCQLHSTALAGDVLPVRSASVLHVQVEEAAAAAAVAGGREEVEKGEREKDASETREACGSFDFDMPASFQQPVCVDDLYGQQEENYAALLWAEDSDEEDSSSGDSDFEFVTPVHASSASGGSDRRFFPTSPACLPKDQGGAAFR